MLLNTYRLEIFNNECMPGAISVQCFAHLDRDIGAALPYVNAVLGGFEYIKEPPSVTFGAQGKLITVHRQNIAINALKDETESIRRGLLQKINTNPNPREALEAEHGQVWTTSELQRDYQVLSFLAPYVVVKRKDDLQEGTLMFQHNPRLYFGFEPHKE